MGAHSVCIICIVMQYDLLSTNYTGWFTGTAMNYNTYILTRYQSCLLLLLLYYSQNLLPSLAYSGHDKVMNGHCQPPFKPLGTNWLEVAEKKPSAECVAELLCLVC